MRISGEGAVNLAFVTCSNRPEVLARCLMASPCLASGRYPLAVHEGCASAAEGFNATLDAGDSAWLVFVHQDVFLPEGWDARFLEGLRLAGARFPGLAVAGVYGVRYRGLPAPQHLGHVLDRGRLLCVGEDLPQQADTLDELCFAVRCDAGLRLDETLGFDFYAADVALQARERGLAVAVVDAWCEHHSSLPRSGFSEDFVARFTASATRFQDKWRHRLPVTTPCITLTADSPATAQIEAAALAAGRD